MSNTAPPPDDDPNDATDAPAPRRPPRMNSLSVKQKRRMLRALTAAAGAGDVLAMQAVVELSLHAEADQRIAAALDRLRSDADEGDAATDGGVD